MENYYDLLVQTKETSGKTELKPFDKEEYIERKKQEKDELYALIDETTKELQSGGSIFQTYLDVQARMDRYAVGNAIIFTAQMPNASVLKRFDNWKEAGVYIKEGEKHISILKPGEEYKRADGSVGTNFIVEHVFDISQTNSRNEEKPVVIYDERLLLKSLIKDAPCGFTISDNMAENVNAIYSSEEKTIFVRKGMDGPSIFRALAQELAHAHMDKGNYNRSECAFPAYCVSYMLCKRNGIAVDTYSFDKLPEKYANMDAKEFRRELGKIREVANDISRSMNRVLEPKNKTPKSKDKGAR